MVNTDDEVVLMDALDHINQAYELLDDLSFSDSDIEQWRGELDNIYASMESRIRSSEEE